ncbi:Chitinase 1 [Tulasnella sp. 332]|nr:Chitinase 1 [Tulasnella sp. 332]
MSFLNVFFGPGGKPEINLANICSAGADPVFTGTQLANCQFLASDIKTCQAAGKIVTISLGGASGGGTFANNTQAASFADQIWDIFLGGTSSTRPFGAAVLDGVDLDIETGSQSFVPFVSRLRTHMNGASKKYYITAAPQCPYPDSALGTTLNSVSFDALYVQFYNNPCGLTHYNDGSYTWNFGVWDYWARNTSPNKNVKVYIGAPGGKSGASSGYVPLEALQTIVKDTARNFPSFGGIMLWDASQANMNGRLDKAIKATLNGGKTCGGTYTPARLPHLVPLLSTLLDLRSPMEGTNGTLGITHQELQWGVTTAMPGGLSSLAHLARATVDEQDDFLLPTKHRSSGRFKYLRQRDATNLWW